MDSPMRAPAEAAGARVAYTTAQVAPQVSINSNGAAEPATSRRRPPPSLRPPGVEDLGDQFRSESRALLAWFDVLGEHERAYIFAQLLSRSTEPQLRSVEHTVRTALQRPLPPAPTGGSPPSGSRLDRLEKMERFEAFERISGHASRFRAPGAPPPPTSPFVGPGFAAKDIYTQAFMSGNSSGAAPPSAGTPWDIGRPKSSSAAPSPTWGPALGSLGTGLSGGLGLPVPLNKGWALPRPAGSSGSATTNTQVPPGPGSAPGSAPPSASSGAAASVSGPVSAPGPGTIPTPVSGPATHANTASIPIAAASAAPAGASSARGMSGDTPWRSGPSSAVGSPILQNPIGTPASETSSSSAANSSSSNDSLKMAAMAVASGTSLSAPSGSGGSAGTGTSGSGSAGYAGASTSAPTSVAHTAQTQVDPNLLSDIGAWLRSLRLHKYTDNLADMPWQDVVQLTDADLEARGVNALGARRKMLKMFEEIRAAQASGTLPK